MTGVEVLNTIEVATEFAFDWGAFWVVCIGVAAICTIIGIIASLTEGDPLPLISGVTIGVLIGFFGGLMVGTLSAAKPVEHETHYQVTLTNEVSMTDFLERYEIVEQSGKILTVKEKGDNNGSKEN